MDKKNQLVIKLNHIILIKGFQKLSMATLARAIGISRASLYLYFKNKDEIVQAVVDRHLDFIERNDFDHEDTLDDLPKVLLNTMLLTGSSTTKFENELQESYPMIFVKLQNEYENYFNGFLAYYQKMQTKNYLVSNISGEFINFQNKATINQILQQTLNGSLAINHAENFLNEYFTAQLNSILVPEVRNKLNLKQIDQFKANIIKEFQTTYSIASK